MPESSDAGGTRKHRMSAGESMMDIAWPTRIKFLRSLFLRNKKTLNQAKREHSRFTINAQKRPAPGKRRLTRISRYPSERETVEQRIRDSHRGQVGRMLICQLSHPKGATTRRENAEAPPSRQCLKIDVKLALVVSGNGRDDIVILGIGADDYSPLRDIPYSYEGD